MYPKLDLEVERKFPPTQSLQTALQKIFHFSDTPYPFCVFTDPTKLYSLSLTMKYESDISGAITALCHIRLSANLYSNISMVSSKELFASI